MKRNLLLAIFGAVVVYIMLVPLMLLPLVALADRAPWVIPLVVPLGLTISALVGSLASDFMERITRRRPSAKGSATTVVWVPSSRATFHVGSSVHFKSDPFDLEFPWDLLG
ncbi:MAG: hypothetical protein A3F35_01605 [Candidatus Woykebacteria bacterium RIFCSPHIGHO2_12_FULL_45_10]|uniref:Uncharacterized protein n=1 Tax=Candidatus Woykebacteria bacterium RIFCSPHIGHO2_12_FULL_45_10 TaxID=1802603 RepID=A0A1G1WNC7_9BACT|nr:MAG: hypothetical protein A3F35_01605 [Candidatus Woykebacteria bacterium RIFCSPHIGHO2_12_FULL_45_10]